ncbi:NAD-dependent epimerase/dehydratase family protein [Rubrobacter indicoceani]|uniref:NAD-dependent epimerase/dehydratase family protein n=1 Tax=Rubrobacter indicoceani TaxID=2051957 RepID=UPI000E5A9BD1|nr:NAD-dependent epimerase/dehydratase family protein [Rubrobacter indicoceani]
MKVAVLGATGNVGTSVLRVLSRDSRVESITGAARRRPGLEFPKTEWVVADAVRGDLEPVFRGADAAVVLLWLIQPSRDLNKLWTVNVEGTMRAVRAAADAGVRTIAYASSVGAYSPGPKESAVDESWPVGGVEGSYYARQKAEVERRLDYFEAQNPGVRLLRMRPGLVFKREASQGIRRLFGGPLFPGGLADERLLKVIPELEGLRSQVVHSYDVGEAFRLALFNEEARGAFNLATEPPLDAGELSRMLGARPVRVSRRLARAGVDITWRLGLHPVPAGWLDLSLGVPVMSTRRARDVLGWRPEHSAEETVREILAGLREGADLDTPPLSKETSGFMRKNEILSGIGKREP